MPGIPTYDNFKATPDILPGARLHAPDLNVEASARGMRVLGKGLDDMGGALSKITFDLQDQANTARVTEALNTLKERQLYLTYDKDAGFRSLKGKNALERPDKKSLDAEYTELLDTARVSLAASLGNDRQRAMFARESGSLMATFRGNLVRHQAEEFRNYQIATHKGVIDVSGQEIALDPANAKAVRNALFRVAASVFEIGRLEGWPADKTDTATRIAQSAAIRGATLTLLDENDAGGAKAFFEAQKDSMTAEDKVSLQSLIKKETDLQSGLQAAQGAFQVLARQRKPDPAQRGFEIAMEAVGRLEYDENGNELPVSGSSMVLEKRKEEYERKVDRFDGDLEKVFAAYDLEDVSIENAIKKAEAENKKLKAGEIPKTWKDFIPEQTRVFVEKQMGQFDAGKSIVKPPTLRNAVSAILSNERLSPPAKKIAMEEVSRLYKQQEAEQKAEAGAAMHEAYLWLSENGYDFNRLPVKIMETVRETAPEKIDDLAAFSKRMKETGGGITDPKALAEYRQMASTSPAAFVGIDFTGVDDLDASDRKELQKLQLRVKSDSEKTAREEKLKQQALKDIEGELAAAGIDTTPNAKEKDKANEYALFKNRLYEDIQVQIDQGKNLTPEEARAIGRDLLKEEAVRRPFWFDTTRRKFQKPTNGGGKIETLPEFTDALNAKRKRSGYPTASPEEAAKLYQKYRASQGSQ